MKRLLASFLAFATLTTPLLAAKKSTVTITENVTVGLTQIRAGEYKLSYEGEGPTVKVTLTRDGGAPVVLDAKLVVTGMARLLSPTLRRTAFVLFRKSI